MRARSIHAPLLLVVLLAGLAGCLPRARHHVVHSLPLTAANAASINTGDAVVSYLRQRDADPEVCNRTAAGPHFDLGGARDLEDVVDGVGQGVHLEAWERCINHLLTHLPEGLTHVVLDRVLERYVERIVYPSLENDERVLEETEAVRRLYEERPEAHDPSPPAVDRAIAALRDAEPRLTEAGRIHQDRLLSVLALERGLMPDGSPVGIGDLDRLLEGGREDELIVFARRIPDPGLRSQAARRLIRLRIRASAFRELAADPGLEDRVLAAGRNVVALEAAPTATQFRPEGFTFRGLLVTQDVARQTASIASFRESVENTSVVPSIDLRGAVLFTVPGWSQPLTVCAGPDSFDPTPCIEAHQLTLGVSFATLEDDGRFRFSETISAADVVGLTRAGGRTFRIPVLFQGRALVEASWPLRVRAIGPLVIQPGYGAPGPQVEVEIDATSADHVYYTARSGGAQYVAVIESDDVRSFGVYAAGGDGEPGADGVPGYDGQAGENGRDAVCGEGGASPGGPGGNGGPGGDGGDGGDGGPGGDLRATFVCAGAGCGLERVVRATLGAPGGAAGRAGYAGPGGAAGPGGYGGSGVSCDGYDMDGAEAGPDGYPGPDGRPGYAGRPGRDGRVEMSTRRGDAAPSGGGAPIRRRPR